MRALLPLLAAAAAARAQQGVPPTRIDPWAANSLRIRLAAPGNSPSQDPPIMGLLPSPPEAVDGGGGAASSFSQEVDPATGAVLRATNGNLQATQDPATGLVTFTRVSDGAVLLRQTGLVFGPAPNGTKSGAASALITFAGVAPDERVVGFGEQQDGQVVKQLPFFRSVELSEYYPYNHGSQALIGWIVGAKTGYGLLVNTPTYGYFNVSTDGIALYSNATPVVDLWVTTTPDGFDPADGVSPLAPILSQHADAVGHAPAMPYFATGYIQSKDRYRNQTQLLSVAREHVARGLPISMIVIDWFHWTNLGDWSFNATCWPDPQGMIDELQGLGLETMVTFWPFMNSSATHFPQFDGKDWLAAYEPDGGSHRYFWTYLQWGALVDTTDPYAASEVFNAWWSSYGSLGVRAIWLDETEPDRAGLTYGDWRLAAGTDYEVGAGWKKTWIGTFSDGLASKGIDPSERFIMSRSMWAGTHKYGNALWSGDLQSTYAELQLQIAAAQGAGLSGQGMFTTDAGGYTGGDPDDPLFQDLIVRWLFFNSFMPLFRLHGHRAGGPPCDPICGCTNGDNEIWTLAKDQAHYDAIVTAMLLREDLRNYVMALSQLHSATGMPMVRPLFLEFPLDPGCQGADVEDEYMFGPDWLVAPVYTYNSTSRSVYLPALPTPGDSWIYWWNQTDVGSGGGARITVNTPLDEYPVFHRLQATMGGVAVPKGGPKKASALGLQML